MAGARTVYLFGGTVAVTARPGGSREVTTSVGTVGWVDPVYGTGNRPKAWQPLTPSGLPAGKQQRTVEAAVLVVLDAYERREGGR